MENRPVPRSQFVLVTPALLAILLWASLATLGTQLLAVPPFLLLGCGFLIGSCCGLKHWRQWKVSKSQLLLGVYGLFGYHFFLFTALRLGPLVEANLLNYLWPLLMTLLAPLFFKNLRLTAKHLTAATLGFIGALLLVTDGQLSLAGAGAGYLFAIGAAVIWSTYSLLCRKYPFPNGALGLFCLISGLMSLACHGVFEESYLVKQPEVIFIVLLGLGPMGAAFFLWDRAVKQADPRVLGGLSYLTPLLSTLLLILFAGGQLSGVGVIAAFLILGSSVLSLL